jgi:flagellar hook-length control protein FliK
VEVQIHADHSTEISVQFSQRDGQLEASLRCSRGDTQALQEHWTELRRVLKEQGVDLLDFRSDVNTGSRNGSDSRYSAPMADQVAKLPARKVSTNPAVITSRAADRSQHRLLESWA